MDEFKSKLKSRVLILAGYLASNEAMTKTDAELSVREIVSTIGADKNISHTALALIASELAAYIDVH